MYACVYNIYIYLLCNKISEKTVIQNYIICAIHDNLVQMHKKSCVYLTNNRKNTMKLDLFYKKKKMV